MYQEILKELDYSIEGTEERLKKVKEILQKYDEFFVDYFDNRFNVNLKPYDKLSDSNKICHLLELMADYILYPDRKALDRKKYKEKTIKKNEILVDDFDEYLENPEKQKQYNENTDLIPQIEISKEDLEKFVEIKNIYDAIDKFKQILKRLKSQPNTVPEQIKIRRIIKALREDAVLAKKILSGMIEFKRLNRTSTVYNFDYDTFYYDEQGNYILVSRNALDFSDKKHIQELIRFYAPLKQSSYEDFHGETKYVLMFLEYLIDNAPLKDYERDYIIWYIDGLNIKAIIHKMRMKYGFNWSSKNAKKCWDTILNKIVQFCEDDYEEWFYTFKARGKYKTCSKCGKVYLATRKYFSINKDSKDGLHSICKKCRNLGKKR